MVVDLDGQTLNGTERHAESVQLDGEDSEEVHMTTVGLEEASSILHNRQGRSTTLEVSGDRGTTVQRH